MKRSFQLMMAAGCCLVATGLAGAQPKLVATSSAGYLTSDGATTIGTILDLNVNALVNVFTRGSGHQVYGPAIPNAGGRLVLSDDRTVASASLYNGLFGPYWGGFGNYAGSGRGHYIPYRFSTTTNSWTNVGSFVTGTPAAGNGAAACDSDISNVYALSPNGIYSGGSAQWSSVYGTVGPGGCNTRGFLYSSLDGVTRYIPPTGTGCQIYSQVHAVSNDGLTVLGTDSVLGPSDPDGITAPANPTCNALTVAVWERASTSANFTIAGRTALSRFGGGGLFNSVMTTSGAVVAGYLHRDAAQYELGNPSLTGALVTYTKVAGVWTRTVRGLPSDAVVDERMTPSAISADGQTIVGTYSQGGFIWRPTINGGVPMNLSVYLQQLNGGQPFPSPTQGFSPRQSISANGNAILGSVFFTNPNCSATTGLNPLPQSVILYLDGTQVPCDQPRIAGGPYNVAQREYTTFGIVGNVFVSGSWPMTLQWQKEVPSGSNNWQSLTDTCGVFDPDPVNPWIYEGTSSFQLRVNMLAPPAQRDGNYRVVVTNSCGTATSQTAAISAVSGACCYTPQNATDAPVCSIELSNRCVGGTAISYFFGGVYLGDNTTCSPTACDAVTGACCYSAGPGSNLCTVTLQSTCVRTANSNRGGFGGDFVGAGTTCTPAACTAVSGACCTSTDPLVGAACVISTQAACARTVNLGGLSGAYAGNGTTCTPTACNAFTGACCYAPSNASNVICTVQTQIRCTNNPVNAANSQFVPGLAGVFAGVGSVCSPANLCNQISGACCYSITGDQNSICTIQTQPRCTNAFNNQGLGGVYRGNNTTCTATACTTVTGACCFTPFGQTCAICTIQPSVRCTTATNVGGLAGTYAGAGTACSPVSACSISSGACCFSGFCFVTCAAECASSVGAVFTANQACEVVSCGVSTGRCCVGSRCVTGIDQNGCSALAIASAGASFTAGATDCNVPGNRSTPCCSADYNKIGNVTVQDIFDYLTGWFTGALNADINGSGAVTVQDIFDYLAAWFNGPC